MSWGFKDLSELTINRLAEWSKTASAEDEILCDRVYDYEEYFADMMFQPGSVTGDYVACESQSVDGNWVDDTTDVPDILCSEPYGYFTNHVRELGGPSGRFIPGEYRLELAPEYLDAEHVILHEMIHLHEYMINSFPTYYHDAVLWCLYKDLKGKISNLDDRISAHGHTLSAQEIARRGGVHDIMFLLKSFDLDLKKGWPLGTVFGYGMAEDTGE